MTRGEAIKIIEDARAVVLCNGEYDNAMRMAIEALKAEPKHGRWIPVTNGRGGFECSVCTNYAPSYQDGVEWLSRFCPNCGAKMDLDEVEND